MPDTNIIPAILNLHYQFSPLKLVSKRLKELKAFTKLHIVMKPKRKISKDLNLKSGSFYIPKGNDSKPLGEDAHFICDERRIIGVADGVGGWAKRGIDSGVYARELMSNSIAAIQTQFSGCDAVNPRKVLEIAYSKTNSEGASTACIMTLTGKNLHAVNVGDSGFIVIRDGETIYRSPIQQKRFNAPLQLGKNSDKPCSASLIQTEVKVGDVIVTGTDGLFDNMFTRDIESTVCQLGMGDGVEPEDVASTLAELALHNSYNGNSVSPFQIAATESGLFKKKQHRGGKIDDITVIVSYVMPTL